MIAALATALVLFDVLNLVTKLPPRKPLAAVTVLAPVTAFGIHEYSHIREFGGRL